VPHGNASARGVRMDSFRIREGEGARSDAMRLKRNRVLKRASFTYRGERWMRPIVIGILVVTAVCGQSARDPGPAVGSRAPDFTALDQDGRSRSLHSLMGPKGLMLVFFRSADW
jgi:hypothetical protein